MHILQVVTQMEAAGAQRVAFLLREELRNAGHDTEIVFLYTKRPAYVGVPGITSLWDHPPSKLDYLHIAIRLFRHVWKSKPDALITHTHFANILGQVVGLLCGVSTRIAVNHIADSVYSPWARLADRLLGSMGAYSNIVAVSRAVATAFSEYPTSYRSRMQIIHNGVSVDSTLPNTCGIKRHIGVPDTAPMIVNVGRLSNQKNQVLLLKLMALMPTAHLVIIGEGEERRSLRRLASSLSVADRVHLIGELNSADTFSIVRAGDVFAFPSLVEAMPMALIEAMLLEKPIVASDISACKEFLGDTGIMLPANNPSAWRNAVEQLLTEPAKAKILGRRARNKASQFNPRHMANEYLALIGRA